MVSFSSFLLLFFFQKNVENELTRKTRSGTIGGFRTFVGDDAVELIS